MMTKYFVRIGVIATIILHPLGVLAQDQVLTLDEAIAEVLSGNQDIQAAHYRSEAAQARIPQAKALEDPMVGVQFYDVPINTLDVNQGMEINYQIEQKIPFPGKRHVRGKAARLDAQVVAETAHGSVANVLLDLKKTYYDLYRLDRSLEVNHENQHLLQQFLGGAQTAYASGKTNAAAALKSQVELSKLKNEEVLLAQERVTHLAHLKAILNHKNHEEIRLPAKLAWPRLKMTLEEVREVALEHRPELKSLRVQEQRDRSKLTAARQGLIPDFSLGFEYNQRPDIQDAWTGMARINLPVFFGKNRGEIREAKANLQATEAEHKSAEIHTTHDIDQAYSAVKAMEQVVTSYQRSLLPQAKTNLEAARLAYTANQVDFLTLIDAALTHQDLQMSYYDYQARYGMAFAELERLVGREL